MRSCHDCGRSEIEKEIMNCWGCEEDACLACSRQCRMRAENKDEDDEGEFDHGDNCRFD